LKSARNSPYEYALSLLAARAYTVRNLRRKLAQKGFEAAESDAAIERLRGNGYLDDEKYAAEFARQRLVVGGSSVRRVEQELAKRGVGRDVAKAAAAAVVDEEEVDTAGAIERLAKKKLASMGDLDVFVKRRRVFGFLARKGYEVDEINQVLSRIFP
jgi:regulatory protein